MTADMITLRDADSLNVVQKPEFKKIKFHPVSYEKIKSKWLKSFGLGQVSKTNDDVDKLAMIGANLCSMVSNVHREVGQQDRAIKLKDYMFRGVYTNANHFYAKENSQVSNTTNTDNTEEVVSKQVDSSEVQDIQEELKVSEVIPSVQETVASLGLEEIKGAVDQAFTRVDDTNKDDEVAKVELPSGVESTEIKPSDTENDITKVVKNSKGKAKVEKFSSTETYHLKQENMKLSSITSSVNDDIFGKRDSETVMERTVPIVAAARDVSIENQKKELFDFSEKDNVVVTQNEKGIGEDTTSKKMADLGRLYDEFNQETVVGQSLDNIEENVNVEISELDKVKEARKKLLEVLKLKEEQDRKTREAKEAAEAAEAERLAIVQKALETAENERKTLEASLNASKEQERQNREKAKRENQVIQELSAMFQGTPVNFVIPTKKTAARGGK